MQGHNTLFLPQLVMGFGSISFLCVSLWARPVSMSPRNSHSSGGLPSGLLPGNTDDDQWLAAFSPWRQAFIQDCFSHQCDYINGMLGGGGCNRSVRTVRTSTSYYFANVARSFRSSCAHDSIEPEHWKLLEQRQSQSSKMGLIAVSTTNIQPLAN